MRQVDQCPACGSDHFQRRVVLDDSNRNRFYCFSELKYGGLLDGWVSELHPEIVSCADCGHHWYLRQPSPEQLSLMYASGQPLLPGTVSREPTPKMIDEMRRLAVMSGKAAPRLLDFGSGFGRWARAAARLGFSVHAYEPSEVRGAELVNDFMLVHDLADICGMQFDVINLEQVLEHVPLPLMTLEQIKAYCSPHTILRITVPNILRSPEGPGIWKDWPYDGRRVHTMAPFEHLHGFTPKSLGLALERAGYKSVELRKLAVYYPGNTMRRLACHFLPRLGQTLILAKPNRE